MKKLLALLLALACMMSFVACGDDKDKGKDKKAEEKVDTEKLAVETVEGFMDAFVGFEFDKMEKFLDDPSVAEELVAFDKEALMEQAPAEFEAYSDQLEKVIDATMDKIKKGMDYEILDTEKDKDDYVVTVELTVPNMEDLNVLQDDEVQNEIINDLLESGKISEDMTEEELIETVFAEMVDYIKNLDVETMTEEQEFVVSEKDGEWLINTDKTDL